jgi:hypothetical protein
MVLCNYLSTHTRIDRNLLNSFYFCLTERLGGGHYQETIKYLFLINILMLKTVPGAQFLKSLENIRLRIFSPK